jgi:hypothetical protein
LCEAVTAKREQYAEKDRRDKLMHGRG